MGPGRAALRCSVGLDRTYVGLDRTYVGLDRTYVGLVRAALGLGRTSFALVRCSSAFVRCSSALAFLFLSLVLSAAPAAAQHASILGQLFTAEHPDSVAAGADLLLIFRTPDGSVERATATAGPHGEYEFRGLSNDPEIQYVIRVTYFGRDFLGAPIHFDSGQTNLAYNFLVSRDAAALPPDAMEGHTHAPGGTMRMPPDRVRQDPVTMTIIVLTALALFALPIMTAERRDRSEAEAHEDDPESAALIRDIASLDLRYSRRELEAADYEAVRRSLLRRLHELKGVEERAV